MNEFLQKSEPRVVAMLLATVVVLATAVLVMYLLWPQFKEYRKLDDSYTILNRAAGSGTGLEKQLSRTEAEVRDLAYRLHGDMAELPDNQMESYIIGRLQKISWRTGVELASVIPGKGERVQLFQETLFDVNINARYFAFFDWLQSINRELGYVVVKKFEIRPQNHRGQDDPQLNIRLTLVSYRMVKHA